MIVCLLFLEDLFLILQGLLLIATKAMSLFMLMVMSIRYTFRGNNLKFIVSTPLEKFHRLYLEVLNFLFLLSRRNMIYLLLGMCISPLRQLSVIRNFSGFMIIGMILL